jgi:hypothetical protein
LVALPPAGITVLLVAMSSRVPAFQVTVQPVPTRDVYVMPTGSVSVIVIAPDVAVVPGLVTASV